MRWAVRMSIVARLATRVFKWESARFACGRYRDRYPDSPLFFSHICHWWQKTRKPLRNLKEVKLERNVTVFDTYRQFLCLPIRGGHSCKVNNKRHGNLIFFVIFYFCNSYRGLRKNNRDREIHNASWHYWILVCKGSKLSCVVWALT